MRLFKTLQIFLTELAMLVVGGLAAFVIGMLLAAISSLAGTGIAVAAFWIGLWSSAAALFVLNRKALRWRAAYEAEGYRLRKIERQAHPRRARIKGRVGRIAIWLPSAIACFVLFFFPIASHVLFSSSRCLPRYRVPLPWTVTVFSWSLSPGLEVAEAFIGRSRITDFRNLESAFSSRIGFLVRTDGLEERHPAWEVPSQAISRDVQAGDLHFVCWQYPTRGMGFWWARCDAVTDFKRPGLDASFFGRESDLGLFYRIVGNIRPRD
jgi:hypothetical protein